jgi:hypothetical protein
MRKHAFIAAIMAALLAFTVATSALAASDDQEISAYVGAADMLSIWVDNAYFDELMPDQTARAPFEVFIYDSTFAPWTVTVTGAELGRMDYVCEEYDEWGDCLMGDWVLVETIAKENLQLRAAAIDHDRVTGYNTAVDETLPALFMEASARSASSSPYLSFYSPPSARLQVPTETGAGHYRTTFTYTIMGEGGAPPE